MTLNIMALSIMTLNVILLMLAFRTKNIYSPECYQPIPLSVIMLIVNIVNVVAPNYTSLPQWLPYVETFAAKIGPKTIARSVRNLKFSSGKFFKIFAAKILLNATLKTEKCLCLKPFQKFCCVFVCLSH
jgi:hypothetical protein